MKTLVLKEDERKVSKVVEYAGHKFKITAESYNSDWHTFISIFTESGGLARIADNSDIPGTEYVDCCSSKSVRLEGNRNNIAAAEKYLEMIY